MNPWWQPSKPGQIKPVPWLSPEATQYLENLLQPDFMVIEHGSGGSTLWFADRCEHVTAIESDPDWRAIVQKQAPGADVLGSTPPIAFHRDCNLLLIDGEPVEDRAAWIKDAPFIVRPGGWIVLDNAPRPEYAKEREGLRQFADLIATFSANGVHHKYLVTEFWKVKE